MIPRYKAIEHILNYVTDQDLVLSTTGMISREVFASQDRASNFYMLGSMGLLSSFGLGLALLRPEQRIFVLEGDGSALMSLGTMPLIAVEAPANLVHIVLDNEAYESTGGQPSISSKVSLADIGRSSGYREVLYSEDETSLKSALCAFEDGYGPVLLVVKVGIERVEGIPRVSHEPTEIRDRFRHNILDCSLPGEHDE